MPYHGSNQGPDHTLLTTAEALHDRLAASTFERHQDFAQVLRAQLDYGILDPATRLGITSAIAHARELLGDLDG